MLAAEAMVDVFARFQDTVDDPPPVTDSLVAESHAVVDNSFFHASEAHALADPAGVRSRTHTGGADAVPNPPQRDIVADSQAMQTTDWVVVGRSRRGASAIRSRTGRRP